MDNHYKLNLVDSLPQPKQEENYRSPIGGFGLREDDLIYQMVLENLTGEEHSSRRQNSRRSRRNG